eukprot:TRINITY_DN9753_c0_g1_i1.p1 TRINITY_DN9753_c0_g1~~TRINITY_DN9753_c0_g1_i1.p1  ORF type:complete len:178 (-),score=42.60 TRINITY_DN9753_c0_g1_i1:34-567(-)
MFTALYHSAQNFYYLATHYWTLLPAIGFGLEILLTLTLSLYFVPIGLKRNISSFLSNPLLIKIGTGYMGLLGLFFLGSVFRVLTEYSEISSLYYQKHAVIYASSMVLLWALYALTSSTEGFLRMKNLKEVEREMIGIGQQAEQTAHAYEKLIQENDSLREKIYDFERNLGMQAKKAC